MASTTAANNQYESVDRMNAIIRMHSTSLFLSSSRPTDGSWPVCLALALLEDAIQHCNHSEITVSLLWLSFTIGHMLLCSRHKSHLRLSVWVCVLVCACEWIKHEQREGKKYQLHHPRAIYNNRCKYSVWQAEWPVVCDNYHDFVITRVHPSYSRECWPSNIDSIVFDVIKSENPATKLRLKYTDNDQNMIPVLITLMIVLFNFRLRKP